MGRVCHKYGYMAEQSKKTTTPSKTKHPGGRPTKLTRELVDKAAEYLSNCIGKLPTKEGLALYLDVNRSTIYEWAALETPLGKEFSYIFEKIMAEQGERLIQGSLMGRFNPTISKMMLTRHDYVEKQAVDHTTNGKELPTPILGGASQEKSE